MINWQCRLAVAEPVVEEDFREWAELGVAGVCLATGEGVGASIHLGSLRVFSLVVLDWDSS